jgi:cytidyltransferase-like protein
MGEHTIVAASGYFDPLHIGHIEYLKQARGLGDKLVVILNTGAQAKLKKGYEFMPFAERKAILAEFPFIDEITDCIDEDDTVSATLRQLQPHIFAKGGDRVEGEIPESPVCREYGIQIVDGLGEKVQSSSALADKERKIDPTSFYP